MTLICILSATRRLLPQDRLRTSTTFCTAFLLGLPWNMLRVTNVLQIVVCVIVVVLTGRMQLIVVIVEALIVHLIIIVVKVICG